jgi:hypothetical protein
MALEFHKLTDQVDKMGQVLAHEQEQLESKLEIALQIMEAYADPAWLPHIQDRVGDAVARDAGYRGARPMDEPIMNAYPPAPLPESALIIATDGSQIAPNTHGSALYYLLNIGTIIVRHGSGEPPEIISQPYLFYEPEYLFTRDRGLITTGIVSARRTVNEMAALAEHAWYKRDEARPMLTLFDGSLLILGIGSDVPDRDQLYGIYFSAMSRLMELNAGLAGYVDRPRSTFVAGLLHLLDLPEDLVSRATLLTHGRIEGLHDLHVYAQLLEPGERSALFVQFSPQNKEFKHRGGKTHEICFFYINVAGPGEGPKIARVEIPMWVATNREFVAELQALIYHQTQQLMSRFPYVLTRADELAVVKGDETRQLNTLIQVALTRYGLDSSESGKQMTKHSARAHKTRFEVEPNGRSGKGKK